MLNRVNEQAGSRERMEKGESWSTCYCAHMRVSTFEKGYNMYLIICF